MKRVTDKMVLIALADRHNEEQDASWPSLAWLSEFCCIDRKTVIASLDRLEADGLIADTGLRTGRTKQIKVYHLAINSTEKGIPKTEPFEANSTVFSEKQSQKRYTEPSREPSLKHTEKRAGLITDDWRPGNFSPGSKCAAIIAAWTPDEHETNVEHFIAHHQAKRTTATDWQPWWKTWALNSTKFGGRHGQRANDNIRRSQPSADRRSSLARACDEALDYLG